MKLKSTKIQIGVAIMALINTLFCFKYIGEVFNFGLWFCFPLIIFFYLLHLSIYTRNLSALQLKRRWVQMTVVSLFVLVFIGSTILIDKENLGIDRWSVIESFWHAAFEGDYPYMANSHQGNLPGPFPFYFLLSLPFLLVKAIGMMPLLAVVAIIILVNRHSGIEGGNRIALILLISPMVAYEIVVQSTILFFSVLFVILAYYEWRKKKAGMMSAFLRGLLLSTRGIYILIVFRHLARLLRLRGLKESFNSGLLSFIAFALTFAPILLLWPGDALLTNPFITQSATFLSLGTISCFMGLSFLMGLIFRKSPLGQSLMLDGVLLFLPILWYAFTTIFIEGWKEAIYGDQLDLSYFIFCVPFILFSLSINDSENEIEQNEKVTFTDLG